MNKPSQLARRSLTTTLALPRAAPLAFGQAGDAAALRRLQEENAALRKQLAEAQGRPAAPAAAAPAAPAARPAA
ncbi:MAG: hypothetical protein ACKOUK_08495, partial [Verrucomicrobiota bacterium]